MSLVEIVVRLRLLNVRVCTLLAIVAVSRSKHIVVLVGRMHSLGGDGGWGAA